MFNNSTAAVVGSKGAKFANPFQCYSWHVLHQKLSYDEAVDVCSWYEEVPFGEVVSVFYVLVGAAIIVSNGLVLWAIITKQQLHQPMYFYVANLAVTDFLAGAMILWHVHSRVERYKPYNVLELRTAIMFSQVMSLSALNLLTLDRFVAVKYPVFYHNQAANRRRNASMAIVSSWVVLALVVFSCLMGWNCMEERYLRGGHCIGFMSLGTVILYLLLILLLLSVLLCMNVVVYKAVKRRQTKRHTKQNALPTPGRANDQERQENLSVLQGQATNKISSNTSGNDSSETRPAKRQSAGNNEDNKKFKSSVHKTRTVMIFAIVAVVFWLLALMVLSVKWILQKTFPEKSLHKQVMPWAILAFCLNSVVNPLAGISRLEDLREAIGQQFCSLVPLGLCTRTRKPKHPQEKPQSTVNAGRRKEQEMVEIHMDVANATTVHAHYISVIETRV